jgi:transcriptional regulator with PAS, ATPase and Fis domain
MVAEGRFRRDLFYRLNPCSITLPPLRERVEDVPDLVAVFLEEFSRKHSKSFRSISIEATDVLARYEWPGNVRELENIIEQAVVLHEGPTIVAAHLPAAIRRYSPVSRGRKKRGPTSLPEKLRRIEADEIRRAIDDADGNLSEAARQLGIHESTIRKKARLYRIRRPR